MTISGLLKCGNRVKCREQVRWDPFLTSWSSILRWTLRPPENRTFLQNPVHSWTEWMIDYERCWTVLQKMQHKSDKHSVIRRMFMSSTLQASVFMWKTYSDNLHYIKNTGKIPFKEDVRHTRTIDTGTIGWDFWRVSNQPERFSMETVICGQ